MVMDLIVPLFTSEETEACPSKATGPFKSC